MISRIRKMIDDREAGFTLIELLVVIIIIGILAAIAIPLYLNQRNNGYDAQAKADLNQIAKLEESSLADNNKYLTTFVNGAGTTAGTLYYKKSSTTKLATGKLLTPAGAAGTSPTNDADGFCVRVQSQSGKYWLYNSITGGLGGGTTTAACP